MSQHPQEFHDDGTPRRKYEFEEREESRAGLHTAVRLALASGLLLMRNFLIGEPMDARASSSMGSSATSDGTATASESGAVAPDSDHEEDEEPSAGANEGDEASLPNVRISSSLTPVRMYDGPLASEVPHRSSALPQAINDNEQLFAAAKGERIDLSQFESNFDTDWSAFGGTNTPVRNQTTGDEVEGAVPARTNRLPVVTGPVVLASLPMNQSALIAVSDLLRNASDPDGDALHIQGLQASSGELVARGNGHYAFMPALGDTSSVIFTYEVSDGEGSTLQFAYLDLLSVTPEPLIGTAEDDTIVGTPAADVIDGLEGDDRIHGREGDDLIYGGAGNDTLLGGDGNDVIHGGGGNDVIYGGDGNDRLFGGDGDDVLFGEAGDDVLFGEAGHDHLFGGFGMDVLFGGTGNDVLDGGPGDDRVFGEDGNDIIVGRDGDGNDFYDGGEGIDTYDASAVTKSMTIDLKAGTATGVSSGEDTLANIENVIGGSGDDLIVANDAVNELTGGDGYDVFVFRSSMSIGKGKGGRDKILDFEVGDRIDLDDISKEFENAVEGHFEDHEIKRFVLIGEQEEFSRPGQIRFKYDEIDGKPVTIIQGNIDHDPDVEFELELIGTHSSKTDYFYSS